MSEEKIKIKFIYNKIPKKLKEIPNNYFDLREEFYNLYENDYVFKFEGREIPASDEENFNKIFDYIKTKQNPIIHVEKKNIVSGEIDPEDEEEEEIVEEEEEPKLDPANAGWTFIGVSRKNMKSEDLRRGRKKYEEEKNIKERFDNINKNIIFIEKQNEGDMSYRNLLIILYTKILTSEEDLNSIKNVKRKYIDEKLISEADKKIQKFKEKYEQLIKQKEDEYSKLKVKQSVQEEIQKIKEKETSDIQKNYDELEKTYKDVYGKLIIETNNLKEKIEKEKLLNTKIDELKTEIINKNNELEKHKKLNKRMQYLESKLKPMEDEVTQLKEKIEEFNDASDTFNYEKDQIMKNIEKINNIQTKKMKEFENQIKKENQEKNDLKKNNDEISGKNKELLEKINQKDESINKLNNEINDLKKEKNNYVNNENMNNENLNKVNEEINNLKRDLNTKQKEKDELQVNYQNLLKEKEALNDNIKQNEEKHKKIIQNLDNYYKQYVKESLENFTKKSESEIKNLKNSIISGNNS